MAITASQVKELRERTGAGMMDCKKALTETNGDMDAAIELMRKSGAAKADKKAGRVAAEGRVIIAISDDKKTAALVEVNSETDFVAKDESFIAFANATGAAALAAKADSAEAVLALTLEDGKTVEQSRSDLIAKIGENIQVRRAQLIEAGEGAIYSYIHSNNKVGVAVTLEGGGEELGRDIAMHITATKPEAVDEAGVSAELVEKERNIQIDIAMESGKPREIAEKMVEGRMRKFLSEITLVNQAFVKDPDQTVGQLVKNASANVASFVRFEAGEGVEKKEENFADEVRAQAEAAAKG